MHWSAGERKLGPRRAAGEEADGIPREVLRAVAFCTEDLQLVKGTARARRRFADLLLTQTHASHLPLLQRSTRGRCGRGTRC